MVVFVIADSKYYQLTSTPDSSTTQDSDWTEMSNGADFEKSLVRRPTFIILPYTVEEFRQYAKDFSLKLDLVVPGPINETVNLYTV